MSAARATNLVVADNISRDYQEHGQVVRALLPASFQLLGGDRIALVGRSGSGKSTLLHLLGGLDLPTDGTIEWPELGRFETLRPTRIGIMLQSPSLVPWLDVVQNVALPLLLAGDGIEARERALAALEQFGLANLATRLPEELSGGQAQRISLVRATITNPPLLLADEPTGQIDSMTGSALLDVLLRWADERGAAIVIATHDLTVAARLERTWHLDHGTMSQTQGEMA